MVDYVEDPFGRIVNVHWEDKDDPDPPETDDDCHGGTWEYHAVLDVGGEVTLDIDDWGIPSHRHFDSVPMDVSAFRAAPNTVAFTVGPAPPGPANFMWLYASGMGPGSKLVIEASFTPGSPDPPPTGEPLPKIPMFVGTPGTPMLGFSRLLSAWEAPPYPPSHFQFGWNYEWDITAPYHGDFPNFDPNDGGGAGVFYFDIVGATSGLSGEYKAWYDYYYGGGSGGDPGTQGGQFYVATTSGGTHFIKISLVCGASGGGGKKTVRNLNLGDGGLLTPAGGRRLLIPAGCG